MIARAATGAMVGLHDRMPVILNADEQGAWLGGSDAAVFPRCRVEAGVPTGRPVRVSG
ncbi:hypothetical protein [Rhodobacter capsulatus]|uniref:hypothetical protein n=1 Tax=Rhodobacter capsulatus TaxID=1061 RepID=UPI00374313F8